MSKRQNIVDDLIELLETITISNDYETDIGSSVHDFKVHFQEDDLPAMSVCDLVADVRFVNGNKDAPGQQKELNLQLRIFAARETKITELRKMITDVNKALGTDKRLGDSVLWINPLKEGIIADEETFEVAGAAVELEIAYLVDSFSD